MTSATSREGTAGISNPSTAVFSFVYAALTGAGMDSNNAAKYALFCQHMYAYIQSNPQVQAALKDFKDAQDARDLGEGARKKAEARTRSGQANDLGLTSTANGLWEVPGGRTAAMLSVFVDRFAGYARAQGIPLHECSLSVANVNLDSARTLVGGATILSAWGLLLAGFRVLSMFDDSYQLAKACLAAL